MSDATFEQFYRDIYADLTVDHGESQAIRDKFVEANPPPDKLVWLRAAAFRIGCEFLSDDKEANVSLLRSINAIVHALEQSCMLPNCTAENEDDFSPSTIEETYRDLFSDLTVDRDESSNLVQLFTETSPPPLSKLIWTRATAFRIASECLSDDDKSANVNLLRCVNVVVHVLETKCMKPKPYVLHMEPPSEMSVESIGLDASIEKAVQHLWDLDVNRLTPGRDYEIDVQHGKKPYYKEDSAHDPLFMRVDETVFKRPTYQKFIALLDNYSSETGTGESVSYHERKENYAFLKAIMQTGPMQFCHKYCRANKPDLVPADAEGFIKLLNSIWFELYHRSRCGRADSSGFEHVFVGEVKNGQVSGFHNWIQFYLEEKRSKVDYRGYIKPRSYKDAQTDSNDHVLTLQFTWNGVEKSVGTSFIGVSPEFEMALYTLCFLVGQEENKIHLDTGTDLFELKVKCYTYARNKVGTSFVEALSHEEG